MPVRLMYIGVFHPAFHLGTFGNRQMRIIILVELLLFGGVEALFLSF